MDAQLLSFRKSSWLPNKWIKRQKILSLRIFMRSVLFLDVFEFVCWTMLSDLVNVEIFHSLRVVAFNDLVF